MNYWVAKANPSNYNYIKKLGPGRQDDWHSRFLPDELQKNDRVFLWESGRQKRIAGLGEIIKPFYRIDSYGRRVCRIRYLTAPLAWMPGIQLLKGSSILKTASFLHGGPIRAFYSLQENQGAELYRLTIAENPDNDIWTDVSGEITLPDVDLGVMEGGRKFVRHLQRERNPGLARKKKDQFTAKHGKLFCESCTLDFPAYGDQADAVFEVHHRSALSNSPGEITTTLSDLAVLCSNCHRAIHRTKPMLSVEKFAKLIRKNNTTK